MGKRTWLNTQLANEFLPAIAQLPDSEAGHQQAIDLAAQLRQSWVDRHFTQISQLQPLFDQTRSQIKAKFGADHFALKYFGLTTEEYTELNNQKLQRTADRNEDVKQIDQPDAIVAKAVALIEDSPHWFDLAAALAVLTGRRSSEILATAQFEKASQWSVRFTGALKRRGERQILSFEIPTLTTADRVIAALAKLRQQLPDAVALTPEEINRKYGDRVVQACERHFAGLVPPRGQDNLYTHLFRAVYATIATFWYCPSWVEPTEYKAAIQGHYAVLDETDPTLRRSLTASRHYADYEIADAVIAQAGGKRKGIKLGHGGIQPIARFQRPDATAAPAPPEARSTLQPQAMSHSAAPQSSKSKRTPRKSVWINYQEENLVQQVLSHFGPTDTTEAKIAAMSRWLHWSLETLETVAPPQSAASDAAEQTAIVTPATTPDPRPTEPTTIAAPPPQVQAPAAEVDELKSMFTQTLAMFQALMQTHTQLSATPTGDHGLAPSPVADTLRPDPAPHSGTVASDRPPKPDTEAATSATAARTQRQPSRSKSPEKATATAALTQQILQAIDDIQHYNLYIDQTQQPHKLKREITANFLKALTPNQRLINRILEQQQQAIDQHHHQLHIQPGHNSSYREKITLAQVQQSLRSGKGTGQD
ncbi:hypothetical protein H6F67_00505 [Microcoleus sp. FACHB-1515]|uniref:protelomerase family protein n=1 Tax=Cyanophyceae TaxID=3028117 RepID=UPI001687AB53|nr:protelomerase family protein [Microcoleus sp. FACHB-1515]MBD2088357.1 hypothetical protein [Microcoleus sp. FACHB-1515]